MTTLSEQERGDETGRAATPPCDAPGDRAQPGRVAFLVNRYPVVSQVFIMNAAAGLIRRGVAVDIIPVAGHAEPTAEAHAVERELAADPGFAMQDPALLYRPRRRRAAAPRLFGAIVARRGLATAGRLAASVARDRDLKPLILAEALTRRRYDVIHCHFATIAPLALAMRHAGLLDGRIVVHFRGYDISRHIREHGADVYDAVFREADWFIANCEAFRERAIELGCEAGRIDIVSSGTDVDRFPFRPRNRGEGPLRLLGIGRLVEKKGFPYAIEAVRLLRARGLDVELTIVGDGEDRATLDRQIAATGLGEHVRLVGALPHNRIAAELDRTHIFISPCVTAGDGDQDAPVNTIKEAMASGVPVVGSRHGGIPEIIEDGVNGLLCDERDAIDLAGKIEELASVPERWAGIGIAGRRTVETAHSLAVATDRTLAAYAKAARWADARR